MKPSAEAKGIVVKPMLAPRTESVLGDAGRLQQIVWNLLTNAVKFTPEGGHIDVTLGQLNSQIELAVVDSG